MVIWWILGILLGLIILLLLLRVGVLFSFGESVSVSLRIGPWTVPLKSGSEKSEKKKAAASSKKREKETAKSPRLSFRDIREAIPVFWTALKKALEKTRRRMRVDPLDLSITFGGEDPAKVAQTFGWANTAMWTVMPQLERLMRIPDPHIHLESDFESDKTRMEGALGLSFHVGDLIGIALTLAIPAARWYTNWKKKYQPIPEQAQTSKAV